MYFLEWMQMRLRPLEKGMVNRSVRTLAPATNTSCHHKHPQTTPQHVNGHHTIQMSLFELRPREDFCQIGDA